MSGSSMSRMLIHYHVVLESLLSSFCYYFLYFSIPLQTFLPSPTISHSISPRVSRTHVHRRLDEENVL